MAVTEANYKSKLIQWDKFSSIRSRGRRYYKSDDLGYAYPLDRQPICTHPIVKERGEKVVKEMLLHTAYKFMFDIAYVEVELINSMAHKIYKGEIDYGFPNELKHDMLAIIIDEAYHAYVAIDFINQVKDSTRIHPFYKSETVELKYAMEKQKAAIPECLHNAFEIIAICIGENTLTKELFSMTKQGYLNPYFHQVMADHMIDEGRHSNIFRYVMSVAWNNISEEARVIIGAILPNFILDYLDNSIHMEFDKNLLEYFQFGSGEIEQIISDTHQPVNFETLVAINPVANNIIDVLEKCEILEHAPTHHEFSNKHLIKPVSYEY